VNKPLSSFTFYNENHQAIGFIVAKDADFIDNNLIPFADENKIWGLADNNGKTILTPKFESLKSFKNGLAPAKQSGKWGFINEKGDWKISPQFDDAFAFDLKNLTIW
jgi:hypothetical protein